MSKNQESKQIEFDIIILDEVGALANDLLVLFCKKLIKSDKRCFKRAIPIAQHGAQLILNLKKRKAYNLKDQSEREDYFQCDGAIICIDLHKIQSIEELEKQHQILKIYNGQEVSVIVAVYSKNSQDKKFNIQDIQNYCNNLKVECININSDTKLDISQIFIQLFASSSIFTQIQNGNFNKKQKPKKYKKFDFRNLIRKFIISLIFYSIIYFFFPNVFNHKKEKQESTTS